MFSAYVLAFATGFISLSQEILWVRLFGFANHSLPQAFAFVLIMYLLGIAAGAHIGRKFCLPKVNLWIVSGVVLVVSGFFDLASPWMYAQLAQTRWQIVCGGCLILLTALFKSILFPLAHHLGTPQLDSQVGRRVSRVYVANIAGATLGPLVTGMLLLDILSTQQCYAVFAMLAVGVGLYCLLGQVQKEILAAAMSLAILLLGFMFTKEPTLLIAKVADRGDIRQVIENSHGIVTIYKGKAEDIVFGGNVYDGSTNLDLIRNSNGLHRLIILPVILQQQPERVLMIGLSIGTWLKILTSFPGVKQIDVVEINPGYLKAMQNYPRQSAALKDPRVQLYIDDGRRWLKTHPDNRYDLIIMNTTYYWRAYTSNLLSQDFLTLLKHHMTPTAVLAYNTTSSPDALKTASTVFSHAYLYENFAIAADYDWRVNLHHPHAIRKIATLMLDGKQLFPAGSDRVIRHYLAVPTVTTEELQSRYKKFARRDLEVITDRNLITEYKYGYSLFHAS